MANERIESLEHQIQQLQVDKIELIRSTSTEIERLRQIIRTLSNPQPITDRNGFKLEYKPLSIQEKHKLSSNQQQQPQQEHKQPPNTLATDPTNIHIEEWQGPPNSSLPSLRESYEYGKFQPFNPPETAPTATAESIPQPEQKTHRSEESIFRLNTKRMSYKGFEFGDFGFMTTDFDQLARGHTQWVNQVMHHPVQNGIVITASDDWCVMFWRFKKSVGNDELKQEKLNSMLNKQKLASKVTLNKQNNYYIDPKLQHICGEIELLPVLKINTGLEVKGIAMSSDGSVLACTCYDEEEDEGNPELQLYFDTDQRWTFKHHQFNPYYGNVGARNKERDQIDQEFKKGNSNDADSNGNHVRREKDGRLISRRIISLPFEPIPHCLSFTRDNKYVFVAMYSSIAILKELNDEFEEEYGSNADVPSKWPDHPVSLCCINIHTCEIRECEKVWKYLGDDEHVSCIAISPNGARIAIGTSLGQLIVTGVLNLTDDFSDEEDFNPMLQKIWSSSFDTKENAVNGAESSESADDRDGSITAIDWSADSDWIIGGHASGVIKFWKRNDKERRLSTQMNRTINTWMRGAKVERKSKMFDCKWYLEGLHIEAINSLSIRGSMMVSGADDGNVVIHDLLQTFIDSGKDNSPITIGRIDKIHGGRMVNSVCLTKSYSEENLLLPSTGFFMVTSGADNIVHCVSLLDVCRESIRQKYVNERQGNK